MEKIVEFAPAFDKRNPDPSKNYGIHGVELRMILKGDKGAVQFVLYTNWHLPHVQQELVTKCHRQGGPSLIGGSPWCSNEPMPADLGYHSPIPRYDGQGICTESCGYLDGKPCYYDGSGLNAKKVYEVLLEKGSDGVWEYLQDFYDELFGEE